MFRHDRNTKFTIKEYLVSEYTNVLETIYTTYGPISTVIDLSLYDFCFNSISQVQDLSYDKNIFVTHPLLFFQSLQAFEEKHPSSLSRYFYMTTRAQKLFENDSINPYCAFPIGIVQSAHQDQTKHIIKLIDVEPEVDSVKLGYIILSEVVAVGKEFYLAYRKMNRYKCCLKNVSGKSLLKSYNNMLLVKSGMYLVVGGSGGIGIELCKFLQRCFQAKLVIMGRLNYCKMELEKDYIYVQGDVAGNCRK